MACETVYHYPPKPYGGKHCPSKQCFPFHPPKLGCPPIWPKPYCPQPPQSPSPRHYRKKKCPKKVIKVCEDIIKTTTWTKDKIWLITAEVHVRCPATLYIEAGTKVLFKECELCNPWPNGLPYASLVIDPGASIQATRVEFRAENGGFNNTGGVIICGTLKSAMFEDYDTVFSDENKKPGCSKLFCCSFNYLGNSSANLNGLTLFYLAQGEIQLSNLSISFAGDDGLEVVGGNHTIDILSIKDALDDGLDLDDDATVNITKSLTIVGRAVVNTETDQPMGTGLVEIIGTGTNTLNVIEGANVHMIGRITDKTSGTTNFSGLFAGSVAGQIGMWQGIAPVQTFIQGSP